ncbi:CWF19, CELL CYCLE CONTROL PROTEIN, putative [Babesia bigemina]|uniref:CWF19, CELL CYCLE CONTROL PROTEIN, putative n=1 Tax=Babesia bigemina TaxID=5866 RepID=A0A061D8Y2_BABBI|nr:CWF19, CELL CYCLE CONTROL PROTEIN, putative [Babesia bigemina]CDR97008.1 CWF19, CELL CYCLE CONTROL PROTEIN, putative [Babesia bigemina]|eukprot:XP_012769194.1 CWF19, CELL CYCLE CONTROL PROTEIN, putative [Babesia bigemina]
MGYGAKRHRGNPRRDGPSDRPGHRGRGMAPYQFKVDEALYQANHEAAAALRRRILVREDAEGFDIGPCQFRQISKFKPLDLRDAPPRSHMGAAEGGCPLCASGVQREQRLSQSTAAFLAMEQQRHAILHDQLVLAPKQHMQSTLYLDDNAYTEIRNYQKTLVRMFDEQGKAVVFVELSLRDPYLRNKEDSGTRRHQHCRIDCFPIPAEALDEAKSFFRKAIGDLVPEWSRNKKVLEVKGKTGVREHIPRGFDFVHVDYSLSGDGIACVVEDASRVQMSFAREVIAGVLRMDAMARAFRKPDTYKQALSWLRNQYQNFDWTNIK